MGSIVQLYRAVGNVDHRQRPRDWEGHVKQEEY